MVKEKTGWYKIRIASAKLKVVHDKRGRRTTLELFNELDNLVKTHHGTTAMSVAESLACPVIRTDVWK